MSNILKAGRYWIGDPCYVLGDGQYDFSWDEFVDFCFRNDNSGRANEGVVTHQGITFAFFGTAYGDGGYTDQFDNEYGVDAGMIACIPAEYASDSDSHLGTFHDFPNDFMCFYRNGTIVFGNIEIPTGDEDEESSNDDEQNLNYYDDEDTEETSE